MGELERVARENGMEGGNVSMFVLGSRSRPGGFFSCEVTDGEHAWVYMVPSKTDPVAGPNASNDLTRRGGSVLTAEEKRAAMDKITLSSSDRGNRVVELLMAATPAESITRSAFYDRKNLDLPYVDGVVALLGDAAHPQSPMMGQGANQAIVDAYVVSKRLAAALPTGGTDGNSPEITTLVVQALRDYDSTKRRKDNNAVIKKARAYGNWFLSTNRVLNASLRWSFLMLSPSLMVAEMSSGDRSNKAFMKKLEKDLKKTKKLKSSNDMEMHV